VCRGSQHGVDSDSRLPARELAVALNWMDERVLHTSFAGHAPTIDESRDVDVLLTIWLGAVYGTAPTTE